MMLQVVRPGCLVVLALFLVACGTDATVQTPRRRVDSGAQPLDDASTMPPPPDGAMPPPPDGAMPPPPDGAMMPPGDGAMMMPPPDGAMMPPGDGAMMPPPDGAMMPPGDGAMMPPPDGATTGPRSCATTADCTGACPPGSMGCGCSMSPMGLICVPTCARDADCPTTMMTLTCDTAQHVCVPPRM